MSLNIFSASVELETVFASAECSKSGLHPTSPSSIEQHHWDLLWKDCHNNSRSMLLPESVIILHCNCYSEEQGKKYATSCEINRDIACMIPCGTWTQVGSYPKPGRCLSWFNLCVGCKIPCKVMSFWAPWSRARSTSQYGLKCFLKSQPALTSSPDSSTNAGCK